MGCAQTNANADTYTHTHNKQNVVEEMLEAVRTPLPLILCDSVHRVTVKSDNLVSEGALVWSQVLSRILYLPVQDFVPPQ